MRPPLALGPVAVIGISSGDHRTGRDLISLVGAAAQGGLQHVILREPQLDERALVDLYRRLAPAFGAGLMLHAGHPSALRLAAAIGCGLHLPARADAAAARAVVKGLLGQSCHDAVEVAAARRAGCDYVLLSPVFAPGSKPAGDHHPLGLAGLRDGCATAGLPVIALGGINPQNAADCLRVGAAGIAAVTALWPPDCTPEDCRDRARRLRAAAAAAIAPGPAPPLG